MKTRIFLIAVTAVFAVIITAYCTVVFYFYPLRHKPIVRSAAMEFEIDPILIASIIRAESNFKHLATSPKGAKGLMQIMPATAKFIVQKNGLDDWHYNLYDPEDNIRIGTMYLQYLFSRFYVTRTVIMAYNAGEGNVATWIENGGGVAIETTPYPETNAYVDRVLNGMKFYKYRGL